MADTDSQGKWAAEAFDALRLHHRVGSRVPGLALLLVGWALLLWLLAQLLPDEGPRALGLPVVGWDDGPTVGLRDVALTDLVAPGALVILLWWLVASGAHVRITYPLLRALWAAGYYLAIALLILLRVLTLPVALILWGIDEARQRLRPPPGEEAAYAKPSGVEPSLSPSADALSRPLDRLAEWVLRTFAPAATIAFSPPVTLSLDEDLLGAKASLQTLMDAYGRLRVTLARLDPRLDFRLALLPETARVAKPQQARRMRSLLCQDALLWSSYVDTQPPRLWVNVEMIRHGPAAGEPEIRTPDEHFDLFASVRRPPLTSVHLLQSDPLDAYVLLLLTLTRVARLRKDRSSGATIFRLPFDLDPLTRHARTLDRFSLLQLLSEVLPEIREPIAWRSSEPTAKRLLIAECLHWAARQLADWEHDFSIGERKALPVLRQLLARCAALAPDNPDAHYMLAVCQCVEGEVDAALAGIAKGQECDLLARYPGPFRMGAVLQMALRAAERSIGEARDVQYALAAIYAAITLRLDREYALGQLRDEICARNEYRFQRYDPDRPLYGGQRALYRLLDIPEVPPDAQEGSSVERPQHAAEDPAGG